MPVNAPKENTTKRSDCKSCIVPEATTTNLKEKCSKILWGLRTYDKRTLYAHLDADDDYVVVHYERGL